MEEIGVVREINGPKALVAVQKQSSCESCPGGKLCSSMGGNEGRIEALNNAHARVGDTVRVVLKPYTYLKGTLLVYGIPSLLLIIGAVIGKEYLAPLLGMDPDGASALGGFGLFALGFLLMRLFTRKFEAKKEYMPVIEEILNPEH
ncbi:MAG: SoxR reducing system RseC family protein [Alphaproteobacteria bacterium]|uniref:SoxR reducing system RseC family protein n=1 Tax=Candidatus Nitrobium versatile TaxID=2884831 RepID=A0A953JG43_9BACT|nr:SoxR reducing system RseC family protein [Candidatus Nitrobium versatile]